ncbi:WD40/YVTN/BNR-like repeat-containing protein [Acidobacteriota bacterium]
MKRITQGLILLALVLTLIFGGMGHAQVRNPKEPTPGSLRLKWFAKQMEMTENSFFKNYMWRFVGPQWMSGRVSAVAVPKGQPYTFYVGTASGGLWKTINEGTSWIPLLDDELAYSIGEIAIAPSDPEILYVGTGEDLPARSVYSGTGIYQSIDGGQTFVHVGLEDSQHIGRIIVHPENPDVVYAAVEGPVFSYSPHRGLYKTTNGGQTWGKILYINEKTGFIDIAMDPTNPDVLYAASWERYREAWNMWYSGPETGLYKSMDGGSNWKKLTEGFPAKGLEGRIGISVSPVSPNIVYVLLDNHDIYQKAKKGEMDFYGFPMRDKIFGAEVYRSDDYGESWKKLNRDHLPFMNYTHGYCFGEVRAHPTEKDTVWILGVCIMKSTDGGQTFDMFVPPIPWNDVHVDHHAMWIDPENADHLILGTDGGINITYDGGQNWRHIRNLPIVQFFHINIDMAQPFNITGTAQDHGCFMGPVTSYPDYPGTYYPSEWKAIPGGEASYTAVDPSDLDTLYAEGMFGSLFRSNLKSGETKRIKPEVREGEEPLRTTWLTPFILSSHNPKILYWGSQYLHRSDDRGDSWQTISPDLTDNDPQRRGNVPFGAITTISESSITPGLVWVGTDDGNIHLTKNGGKNWIRVNGLEDKWASRVEASHFDEGTAFVSLNGYREDDCQVYLYRVMDFGKTVEDIGAGVPGGPINVIREDLENQNVLYLGTDTGVFISLNKGKTWDSLTAGLPVVPVHELVVHPRDKMLVAGTYGRSIYVLDISPIQQFTDEVKQKDLHLFPIKPFSRPGGMSIFYFPAQVDITYYTKEKSDVQIEALDKDGKTVWQNTVLAERGFNKVVWNLKTRDETSGRPRLPKVGRYTIQIKAGTLTSETELELK